MKGKEEEEKKNILKTACIEIYFVKSNWLPVCAGWRLVQYTYFGCYIEVYIK